jgi:hypothetical protein
VTVADPPSVPRFTREFFGALDGFTRIGAGDLGGKASGLHYVRSSVLSRYEPAIGPGVTVSVPTLTVLATDVFDAFMDRNALYDVVDSGQSDDRIAHAFQRASLPAEYVGDLRGLIGGVHTPLAVRSSSLLEDALDHPFAGVYGTKMIPNNQPDIDTRFQRLVEAVKFVYASTFFRGARHYVESVGQDPTRSEKMAVIVQEVVGDRHGDRFYPTLSAVARSYNYYPTGHATAGDGVVNLALGLGKQIVDGGLSWSYAPPYPKAPPPFADARDLLKNTQRRFWAVHMGRPPLPDPVRETEFLVRPAIDAAESDGTLDWLASTYDPQSDLLRPGMRGKGARALTFAPLLAGEPVALTPIIRRLLELSEDAVGAAVELELAMTLDPRRGVPARLGFLQMRPMMVSEDQIEVSEAELRAAGVLLCSTQVLGNGERSDLSDVVYVRPEAFDPAQTRRIATELDAINRRLVAEGRPYLLIGFGRWGSSDPWLGVPVEWAQIDGARVIVEASLPNMNPDLSQGSHFFHNLIGFKVLYLSLPDGGPARVDWAWLDQQPAAAATEFVRHVRLAGHLTVRVDGRNGRGVVREP